MSDKQINRSKIHSSDQKIKPKKSRAKLILKQIKTYINWTKPKSTNLHIQSLINQSRDQTTSRDQKSNPKITSSTVILKSKFRATYKSSDKLLD